MYDEIEKEIEYIRKEIENISMPIISDKNKSLRIDTNKKSFKERIIDNEREEKLNNDFNAIYELYNNDEEYKRKIKKLSQLKKLTPVRLNSIECGGNKNLNLANKPEKFKIRKCIEIIGNSNHHARNEANFEDDFSSSDSYDSNLFPLEKKAPKNFKFRSTNVLEKHRGNLNIIVSVLKSIQ